MQVCGDLYDWKGAFIISLNRFGEKSAEIVLLEVASGQTGNNKVINKALCESLGRAYWKTTIFHPNLFSKVVLQSRVSEFRSSDVRVGLFLWSSLLKLIKWDWHLSR